MNIFVQISVFMTVCLTIIKCTRRVIMVLCKYYTYISQNKMSPALLTMFMKTVMRWKMIFEFTTFNYHFLLKKVHFYIWRFPELVSYKCIKRWMGPPSSKVTGFYEWNYFVHMYHPMVVESWVYPSKICQIVIFGVFGQL